MFFHAIHPSVIISSEKVRAIVVIVKREKKRKMYHRVKADDSS
jgi:hypothetical protein